MNKTVFVYPALYKKDKVLKEVVFYNNTGNMVFTEISHKQIDYNAVALLCFLI